MFEVDCPPVLTGSTFIVRIWMEWSKTGSCWRGQIVHAQSGERMSFLCFDDMLRFIQGYVAMPESEPKEPAKHF